MVPANESLMSCSIKIGGHATDFLLFFQIVNFNAGGK